MLMYCFPHLLGSMKSVQHGYRKPENPRKNPRKQAQGGARLRFSDFRFSKHDLMRYRKTWFFLGMFKQT